MEIKELQERVDAWIREYGVRYFSELTNMACLTEEVGELARVMARKYGDQSFKAGEKENLADEMADVLWVLVCLANQTGVDLTAAVEANFAKKTARDKERHRGNPKLRNADGGVQPLAAPCGGFGRRMGHFPLMASGEGSASWFGQFQRHGAGNYLSLRFVAGKA